MTAVSIIRSEDSGEMLEETKRVSSSVDAWLEKQTQQLRVHTPYSEGE